jgi:hypothetical protein
MSLETTRSDSPVARILILAAVFVLKGVLGSGPAGARASATPNDDPTHFHAVKLAEVHHNFVEHLNHLDDLKIEEASERLDAARARKLAWVLETDGRKMTEHATVLASLANGEVQAEELLREAELEWGTAMALASLFTPETPLNRRIEALSAVDEIRKRAEEMGRSLANVERNLNP